VAVDGACRVPVIVSVRVIVGEHGANGVHPPGLEGAPGAPPGAEQTSAHGQHLEGEIYALAGGTPARAALAMAIGAAFVNQLRDKACRVMSSDLRVRVLATGLATYPDVTVVCGALERDPESRTTVVNPTVVVKVPSAAKPS